MGLDQRGTQVILTPAELRALEWIGSLYSIIGAYDSKRIRIVMRWAESYNIDARMRKRLRRLARHGLVRGRSTGAYQITRFGLKFIGVRT